MGFAKDTTREAVERMALGRYPEGAEDAHGYEAMDERVFALLVDVAAVYVDIIADQAGDRFAAELDGAPVVRTLGDLMGGPMEMALQGLRENLEMRTAEGGGFEPV